MYSATFKAEHSNTLQEYVFDLAPGANGRLVSERPAMPAGSGAVPGEFFVMNPNYQARRLNTFRVPSEPTHRSRRTDVCALSRNSSLYTSAPEDLFCSPI